MQSDPRYLVARERYDGAIWFPVIEPMWRAVRTESRTAIFESLHGATPGQLALFATARIDAEVCHGGFDQLFYNAQGGLAFEALAGLHRLGAREHADVLIDAMFRFPGGQVPRDRFSRRALIELLPEGMFDRHDNRWYSLQEDLDGLRNQYVHRHPEEFFAP